MSSKLPLDSLILVTGANGFIASHIVDQLLALGYRVRGTVRQPEKKSWLREYFDKKYGTGKFQMVEVVDFSQPGSFDEAAKGCAAFAHCASDMNMDVDPLKSVQTVIDGANHAISAAAKEPGMRTFVLTSSSTAATFPIPNKRFHIGMSTWNEDAIREGWAATFTDLSRRRWATYGASKAQGEQAIWKFAKEKNPHFSVNTILPNANFGPTLLPEHQDGSTSAWVKGVYYPERWAHIRNWVLPQYFVDVRDTARIHAALLTHPEYKNERLFAFAEPFNWSKVLDMLRELTPDRDLPENPENDPEDLSTVENERAKEILKEVYGQSEFIPLKNSLVENVKDFGTGLPAWFQASTTDA